MKGRGRRKLNLRRTEKGINFIYGYACTEMMGFSIKISCVCLSSLHADKPTLATGPRHLHANPETAVESVARAGIYSEAVKKGDLGFCTGIRSVHKSSRTAVTQWKVSFRERTVKNTFPGTANIHALNLTFSSISKVNRCI